MARVTDEYIEEFARKYNCDVTNIERRPDKRGKSVIYVKYYCKCGDMKEYSKKWKEFVKMPMCKLCALGEKPRVTDDEIRQVVENKGHEFISAHRNRVDKKTRIIVTFICKCDKDTTRVHKQTQWESIKRGATCNVCGNQRRKETNVETYAKHGEEIKGKIKATNMEKYGVLYPQQTDEVKAKIIATNMERYGVVNPGWSDENQRKIRETTRERYGVDFAMQNSELRDKQIESAYKTKLYAFPSGRTIKCQGYEPFAFDLLLQTHEESDILTDNEIAGDKTIPEFWYINNGSRHRYYPDIFINSEQKIIEVKSEYTRDCDPITLELKMEAVFNAGFEIEIWTFDSRGNLTIN